MNGPSPTLALIALAVVVLGVMAERALLIWRWMPYFSFSVPIGPRLVPIPEAPEGAGETATVRWEAVDERTVRFWADPKKRAAPTGLHGVVSLHKSRHGFELEVRWAPMWTPLVAVTWLAGVGLARGDGLVTVPIATVLALLLLYFYQQAAVRAAAELRWSWVRGDQG